MYLFTSTTVTRQELSLSYLVCHLLRAQNIWGNEEEACPALQLRWILTEKLMSGLVQRGEAGARENSEVLVVMHKVGLVLSVDELTGLLYILGHSWRAAAEYSKLPYLWVNLP